MLSRTFIQESYISEQCNIVTFPIKVENYSKPTTTDFSYSSKTTSLGVPKHFTQLFFLNLNIIKSILDKGIMKIYQKK